MIPTVVKGVSGSKRWSTGYLAVAGYLATKYFGWEPTPEELQYLAILGGVLASIIIGDSWEKSKGAEAARKAYETISGREDEK